MSGERGEAQIEQLECLVRNHSANYNLLFRTTLAADASIDTTETDDDERQFRHCADHWVQQVAESLAVTTVPLPPSDHDAALNLAISYVRERV